MDASFAESVKSVIRKHVDDAMRRFDVGRVAVTQKAPRDLVSELDVTIGTSLSSELTALLPGSSAYTEDGRGTSCAAVDAPRWIIDPIDGTANLIMGNSHYCTSVALERAGTIEAGFVYHPPTSRMFWAVSPEAAFVNETRLSPSVRTELADSYVVFGFSANLANIERYHREWTPAFETSRKAIGLLAPALNICTVALGSVDAFIDFGCSMEGQAAAGFILKSVGGRMANYDGTAWDHRTVGVIATNARIRVADLQTDLV